MEFLNTWWGGLDPLTRWFFGAAFVFSVFLLWQLIMAFIGLTGGDGSIDSHAESVDVHHSPADSDASVAAFKLLSFRSIVAFFTLFFWSGGLALQRHATLTRSMGGALLWGLIAMVLVAALLYLLRRMAETGNLRYSSCVGVAGTVYLDIPAGGVGEVRALCSGVMTHLKARTTEPAGLKAGTDVRIVKLIGVDVVEVAAATGSAGSERKATP